MKTEGIYYPNFSMLISKENYKAIDKDENLNVDIVNVKELSYDPDYDIITFAVMGEDPEDYDPEILLNTMGGIAIHEMDSNGFIILDADVSEVNEIFCWSGAGQILMGELLTPLECEDILGSFCSVYLPAYKDIYIEDATHKDVLLNGSGDILFKGDGIKYKLGKNGAEEILWWPNIIEKMGNRFFFVIINTEEKTTKDYPSPWDDDADYFYTDYDEYYYKERFDT